MTSKGPFQPKAFYDSVKYLSKISNGSGPVNDGVTKDNTAQALLV